MASRFLENLCSPGLKVKEEYWAHNARAIFIYELGWKQHYTSTTSQIHVMNHDINSHLHWVGKLNVKITP
jgi:hypothetical protein